MYCPMLWCHGRILFLNVNQMKNDASIHDPKDRMVIKQKKIV